MTSPMTTKDFRTLFEDTNRLKHLRASEPSVVVSAGANKRKNTLCRIGDLCIGHIELKKHTVFWGADWTTPFFYDRALLPDGNWSPLFQGATRNQVFGGPVGQMQRQLPVDDEGDEDDEEDEENSLTTTVP